MLPLMGGQRVASGDRGFTLIELAVVMIIIAVLAAIAIPVFFRQRDKGLVAQSQSALANAKLGAESYYVGDGEGSYAGLDEDAVFDEGVRVAEGITLIVDPDDDGDGYCIAAVHPLLPETDPWQTATVTGTSGTPTPGDDC